MGSIVENVVYQHAENVCALWLQRQNAVDEPHYSFNDLAHLDSRLDANLEGLRVAGQHALPIIDELLDAEDEGACFAKALLSLESDNHRVFHDMIQHTDSCASERYNQTLIELDSALAWTQAMQLKECVRILLSADDSSAIILGLNACASHNRDPSHYLNKYYYHEVPEVRETVIRVAANRGATSLAPQLLSSADSETERETFERGRALSMLGKQNEARTLLGTVALSDSAFNSDASALYVLLDDKSASKALLKALNEMPDRQRDVVRGFGLLGDPAAMEWLIEKTSIPEYARLAGGAISMITGVNLSASDLELMNAPEGYEDGGITDNPEDDTVALDEDEELPWPDADLISAWWGNSPKLTPGKTYLGGREKTHTEMVHVLANGLQRQRNAAAMSLALLQPDAVFLDTRLPTSKQKVWMT